MTQNLSEFFREKKLRSDAESAGIDWSQRRSEWLAAVEQLYVEIEGLLAEARDRGFVSISRRPKEVTEEHLGTYTVDELVLRVGDEAVIFSPKGRNIAGAHGRVDVRGEAGEGMLLVQPDRRWCVVMSRYPTLKLVDLSAGLGEMLKGVTRQ